MKLDTVADGARDVRREIERRIADALAFVRPEGRAPRLRDGTVVPQPSRLRMALVMIVVVYGLVLSLGALVAFGLAGLPPPARLLVTITIEVLLMTYVVMPRLTRWLARWIYPHTR